MKLVDHLQRDPDVGHKINRTTNDKLSIVFDTVALESTAAICAKAIGSEGGVYCNLLGIDCPRPDVRSTFFLGYSMSGESYIFEGDTYPAVPEDLMFATEFMPIAEKLWTEGEWKAHPERVEPRGLLGAIEGMQAMREGNGPSGEKIVYCVDDTKWPSTE